MNYFSTSNPNDVRFGVEGFGILNMLEALNIRIRVQGMSYSNSTGTMRHAITAWRVGGLSKCISSRVTSTLKRIPIGSINN